MQASPTLTTPNLGTPSALVGTNITGTAASLTVGNATTAGTCTGNAATVTTNANLTGMVTSVGNAASLGSFTSAQLKTAVTDETGNGALVFSSDPTFSGTAAFAIITSSGNITAGGNLVANNGFVQSGNVAGVYTDYRYDGNISGYGGWTGVTIGGTLTTNGDATIGGAGVSYPDAANYMGVNANQIGFGYSGGDVYVSVDNAASGVFVSLSDYRIKKDVRTLLSNATYITNAIRVVDYEVLELDGTQAPERAGIRRAGVIAHEIQELIPNAASGTKDAVNADGSPRYQSVNYDAVVPFLIKTIQELTARIEKLEG